MSDKNKTFFDYLKSIIEILKNVALVLIAYWSYAFAVSEESIFNKKTMYYDRIVNIIFDVNNDFKKNKQLDFLENFYEDEEIKSKIFLARAYIPYHSKEKSLQIKLDSVPKSDKKTRKILKKNIQFLKQKQDAILAKISNPKVKSNNLASNTDAELEFISRTEGLYEWNPRWASNKEFVQRIIDSSDILKTHLEQTYSEMHKLPDDPNKFLPQMIGSKFQRYSAEKINELRETIKKMDSIEFHK